MEMTHAEWLTAQLGPFEAVEDLSWDLQGLVVTHVRSGHSDLIVKHGGNPEPPGVVHPHMRREVRAYERWISAESDFAPRHRASHAGLGVLVTEFLPGDIALRGPGAQDPHVWRAAGAATAQFNAPVMARGSSFDGGNRNRALERIDHMRSGAHAFLTSADRELVIEVCAAAERLIDGMTPAVLDLVPTHADNSPRNWMVSPDGETPRVRLIDFGRAGVRPAYAELDHVMSAPEALRTAFMEGMGLDPDLSAWPRDLLRSFALHSVTVYLGGVTWARDVNDPDFESDIIARAAWLLPLLTTARR